MDHHSAGRCGDHGTDAGTSPLHASPSDVASLPDPDEDFLMTTTTTTTSSAAAAAAAAASAVSPPLPAQPTTLSLDDPNHPANFNKPSSSSSAYNSLPTVKKTAAGNIDPGYILGTLIVRVVAARALEPPNHRQNGGGGGLRQALSSLGGGLGGGGGLGCCNPYASVRFGGTTQRTSEVFDSLDPVWPRSETMFLDVSVPVEKLTHPDPKVPTATTVEGAAAAAAAASPSTHAGMMTGLGRSSSSRTNHNNNDGDHDYDGDDPYAGYSKPSTMLSVALFSTPEIGRAHKFPSKAGLSGDSDDAFLGVALVDLTRLFTGKEAMVDRWFQLKGGTRPVDDYNSSRTSSSSTTASSGSSSCVRIVCEYEPSDAPPKVGDVCRFTRYCHPRDLYPLEPARPYKVDQVHGDQVLLSYVSHEGWVLSFQAHKNMLICEERHISAMETAQDELATLTERLAHSPLVQSVTETAERVTQDGLVGVGEEIARGGAFLVQRWFQGGFGTVVSDLQNITNLDGRHNPDAAERLELQIPNSSSASLVGDEYATAAPTDNTFMEESVEEEEALPNMPPCPITGFPMVEPVVAADGHTYERIAIQRWLATSDKSPMTGSILIHKELVPNYGLMSSVQEMATREKEQRKASSPSRASKKPPPAVATLKRPPKPNPPELDSDILDHKIERDDERTGAASAASLDVHDSDVSSGAIGADAAPTSDIIDAEDSVSEDIDKETPTTTATSEEDPLVDLDEANDSNGNTRAMVDSAAEAAPFNDTRMPPTVPSEDNEGERNTNADTDNEEEAVEEDDNAPSSKQTVQNMPLKS